jgi:tetratricopeptide (TPR) repeat protein
LKIPQIFDLNKELPKPVSEEEIQTIQTLDEISKKITQVLSMGGQVPEEYSHHVLQLTDNVLPSIRASVVLGHIFWIIREFTAMRDLYRKLIDMHGESHILLFYFALAKEKCSETNEALELYNKIIGSGCKNFHVYMQASRIYREQGDYSKSTTMANLAIYENHHESIEPFVTMANNFFNTNEINKMFECFSRIEKIAGKEGLSSLGELYEKHQKVYHNLKNMLN